MKEKYQKTQQQKQNLIQQYKLNPQLNKKSLCRFYLRGICLFHKSQCKYSHGINDLYYTASEQKQFNKQYYHSPTSEFSQKSLWRTTPQKLSYVNLYQFQNKYTLQEINKFRDIKNQVRKKFHQKQFQNFIKLLQKTYDTTQFKQEFIQRQYYRVGFNKLMTRIKFGFLIEYLCQRQKSEYMRVNLKKKIYIVKKQDESKINPYYTKVIIDFLKNKDDTNIIKQNELRTYIFLNHNNFGIPILGQYLKKINRDLKGYIQLLKKQSKILENLLENYLIQSTTDKILLTKQINKILDSNKYIIEFQNLVAQIVQNTKLNVSGLTQSIRQILIQKGYQIYFIPLIIFIYKDKLLCNPKLCQCNLKKFDQIIQIPQQAEILTQKIITINNQDSYKKCLATLMKSKILGVDLEGKLRKNGFIQIIQLNNTNHIYLFDIYDILTIQKNHDLFQKIKKVIKYLMINQKILKIFHDGRHDSLALHQFMQTCIINVFDTSGIDIYRTQIQKYKQVNKLDNNIINQLINIKSPGINELLKKYNAPNGINPYKQQFHKLMKLQKNQIFHQRPLDKRYEQYCIFDVLDLPYLSQVMSEGLDPNIIQLIGNRFIQHGYKLTL